MRGACWADRKAERRNGCLNRRGCMSRDLGTFGALRVAGGDWDIGCKSVGQSVVESRALLLLGPTLQKPLVSGSTGAWREQNISSAGGMFCGFGSSWVTSVNALIWSHFETIPVHVFVEKTNKKYLWFKSQFKKKKTNTFLWWKEALKTPLMLLKLSSVTQTIVSVLPWDRVRLSFPPHISGAPRMWVVSPDEISGRGCLLLPLLPSLTPP